MKICRIVYEMPPPWDGLAPHPYEITLAQSKKAHEITVFCGRWPKAGPLVEIKGVKAITISREPLAGLLNITSSFILLYKYLSWRKKNTPDIIHSHGHFAIWIYLYRKLLSKFVPWSDELKIPLVVHYHNTAKGRWESFIKDNKPITPISKMLAWPLAVKSDSWATEVASACIFVSEDTKKEALQYYKLDPRRAFVVETGVNVSQFVQVGSQEKDKSRKDMNLDSFDKVILNLGMMVERKNIHVLVDALKHLPYAYKLVLVGHGDAAYTQKLSAQITSLGLEDRVIRIGYTPYPYVPIAYQVSDIFVLPSSWEGLPKVVMESLACGVPCLVSGFKLSDEVHGLYYLENLEPADVAKKIQEVVESGNSVDRQKVAVKYSWEERIKEIEKIYDFAKKNILI